ncbi:MAG: hypothetical protein GX820_04895 [Bacteroidales bacterium]|nr:hypothetical protein [Bacteroidales bacterium]
MKKEIKFEKTALSFLEDLADILLIKEYFSFVETADRYIEDIVSFIMDNIYTAPHKSAPPYFAKYGKSLFYISYNRNKNTTWYIFFEKTAHHLLIRHITNNHIAGKYFE